MFLLKIVTAIFVLVSLVGCLGRTLQQSNAYLLASQPAEIRVGAAKAVLEIVLIKGAKVTDPAPSAKCPERIEGVFAARVRFEDGKAVDTQLNRVLNAKALAFCAKPWRIVTTDYNGDGQIDFNLGQFGNSNGWEYWLFTISHSGRIFLIDVANERSALYIADNKNSTEQIELSSEDIKSVSFANMCDKEKDCGWWETTYRWNKEVKRFERHTSKHLDEYTPAFWNDK